MSELIILSRFIGSTQRVPLLIELIYNFKLFMSNEEDSVKIEISVGSKIVAVKLQN